MECNLGFPRRWQLSSGVEQALSLDDLFARSDFITLHVPLAEGTRGLVSEARLKLLRPGATVLNFARGGMVDDSAVLAALDAGKLAACVCDFPTSAIKDHPRVVALPHLGASTLEAEENCAVMVADTLRDFLENGNVRHAVNFPESVLPRIPGTQRIAIANSNVPNMVGQISTCLAEAGLNIPCIKLCKGDTISDVTYKLATELCTILDYLKVTGYDLSCFNLASCAPNTFQELIQFLIDRICELENIKPTGTTPPSDDIANYPLQAAACFGGGTITLVSYVNQIANRICEILEDIDDINNSIASLDIRVTTLANAAPPSFTMPSFAPDCTIGSLPAGSQPINLILQSFINDVWCDFYQATGSTADLISAVNAICIADSDGHVT